MPNTENHGFARPDEGSLENEWGQVINEELIDPLEERVPVLGADPSSATPHANGLYVDTSNGEFLTGDGESWSTLGELIDLSSPQTATGNWTFENPIAVNSELSVSDTSNQIRIEDSSTGDEFNFNVNNGEFRITESGVGFHFVFPVDSSDDPISLRRNDVDVRDGTLTEQGEPVATETWVDNNYGSSSFEGDYQDLTNREHGNEDHSEDFAVDGDAQPPESHGNAAHSADFAVDGETQPPENHANGAHSLAFISDGDGTDRQFWVSTDGSIPSGAADDDVVLTPSN